MLTRITAARRANVTSLLVFASGFLVALCALAARVSFFTDRTFLASLDPAFTLVISLYIVWVVAFWLYNRRVSGGVLLDCGPHKGKAMFLLIAAFLVFQELLSVISAKRASSVETVQEFLFAAFFLYFFCTWHWVGYRSGKTAFGSIGVCSAGTRFSPTTGRMTVL